MTVHGIRRISVCREGWYHLLVVLFIFGGAVLREINLLVVLGGVLVAPAIFNWRIVAATLYRLRLNRGVRSSVFAGDEFTVEMQIANERPMLPSWAIVVQDQVRGAGERKGQRVEVVLPYVAPGETARACYYATINRRGRHVLGPLKMSTRFPLGLVRSQVSVTDEVGLIVLPRLGKLSSQWTSMLDSSQPGVQSSARRRGVSDGDYYALREWRSGDSRRWIHWRTSARLNTLVVRQFEDQQRRDIGLVLDLWLPDDPTDQQRGALELAISFAATVLTESHRTTNDILRVAAAGRESSFWGGQSDARSNRDLLQRLAVIEGGVADGVPALLDAVRHETGASAPVVVISTRSLSDAHEAAQFHSSFVRWIDVRGEERSRFFTLE
ncbi:MAG: DUF58 domain-containing protein [Pirellulaceae bacterium]|nr:DUF58 domain-containing protein [Pirellulaceae bacterium]